MRVLVTRRPAKKVNPKPGKIGRKRLMIKFELLRDIGVLVVEPKNALSTEDFREISRR